MSQNPIVEETKLKLDELEKKIQAVKSGASREIADDAHKDWQDMVDNHAEIRRKLDAAGGQSNEILEGVRMDVDVLRHSFERWMARVEGNFSKGSDKT